MCGIAGWVSFTKDLNTAENSRLLRRMIDVMFRRGPDGNGMWTSQRAALGHQRLALVDAEGGKQPMVLNTPGGNIALTFSGEIHNFRELRRELESFGHTFRTNSDTEVLLLGYMQWGNDVATRLRGQFAYGIWDGRTERLVLTRDPSHIKPLYYQNTRDGVLFGSEMAAIQAHPLGSRNIGIDQLTEFASRACTPGAALFADIHELEPGHTLTATRDGLTNQMYWQLQTIPHTHNEAETKTRASLLFGQSVGRNLVADADVGALSSGGIDSAGAVGVAYELTSKPRHTFTLDFAGSEGPLQVGSVTQISRDAAFATEVAQRVRSIQHNVVPTPEQLNDPELAIAVARALGTPRAISGADSALYLLMQAVHSKGIKAVLTGEGADELFGGYLQFHNAEALTANTFPWLAQWTHQQHFEDEFWKPEVRQAMQLDTYRADMFSTAIKSIEFLPGESRVDRLARQCTYLHLTRFLKNVVNTAERIGMNNGVEVRLPYLDQDLMQYVYNVPWRFKTRNGIEKSLLRDIVAGVVPNSVLNRTKSGFPTNPNLDFVTLQQRWVLRILESNKHPLFDFVDTAVLRHTALAPPGSLTNGERQRIDQAIQLDAWITTHSPTLSPLQSQDTGRNLSL